MSRLFRSAMILATGALLAWIPSAAYGACQGATHSTTTGAKIYRGDILRFSFGSTVSGLPSDQRTAFYNAFQGGRSKWNSSSCNQGGDDFPWVNVVSPEAVQYYSPGLKMSGSTILDVKVNYYDTQGSACATYNPTTHRLNFYAKRPGSSADCEAKQFFDKVAGGGAGGHITADLEALIAHEIGHAFGLGESTDPSCIMGGQQVGNYGGSHWHKTSYSPHSKECNDLDKLTNNEDEISQECDANPDNCDEETSPPPGGGGFGGYPGDGLFTFDPLEPLWPPSIDDLEPTPVVTTSEVYCIYINFYFCFCADEKGC